MISGPSGVGKGTVCARLRTVHPEAFYSVSMTTRPARQGEVDGVHYHFVDADEFRRLIERGELLEWAVVHGTNYYGTPKAPVDAALSDGRCVVLEIDLQGARQVKRNLPEARLVFLEPPAGRSSSSGCAAAARRTRPRRRAASRPPSASWRRGRRPIIGSSTSRSRKPSPLW